MLQGLLISTVWGVSLQITNIDNFQESAYRSPKLLKILKVQTSFVLLQLLGNVTIAAGGVLPIIHSVLLPKKTGKKEGASGSVSQEF